MTRERKSTFKGKVVSSDQKQRSSKKTPHLIIPKGIKLFKLPEGVRSFSVDFLPYIVSNEKHPERDDKYGVAIPGSPWYRLPYKVHTKVGVENESIVCPRPFGKKCPICEYQLKR